MSRSSAVSIGLAVYFALAYMCGYSDGKKSAVPPAPAVCPQPKPEPERCMAFWFGKNADKPTDMQAMRRQVCGQDTRASTPRK